MTDICATFEEWYLGDGTYPPLHRGQKVNLSFYVLPTEIKVVENNSSHFKQIKHSNYSFCGLVIRNYLDSEKQIIIVDTGDFKFYIEQFDKSFSTTVGQFISGTGQLLLDYYIWVENLSDYENAPDIFYNFSVDKILIVRIPEKFIHRHDKGLSAPTSLAPSDYADSDVIEIEDMRNEKSDTSFYLLNLTQIDERIEKTFT
jgi:hypothetical protein